MSIGRRADDFRLSASFMRRHLGKVLRVDITPRELVVGSLSGAQKMHAIVGGFQLGPAPEDYPNQVVALDPT